MTETESEIWPNRIGDDFFEVSVTFVYVHVHSLDLVGSQVVENQVDSTLLETKIYRTVSIDVTALFIF